MNRNQQLKDFARKLVALSLDDERRVSPDKVTAVLEALSEKPPRQHSSVLKLYAKLIKQEIARSTALIETEGDIEPDHVAELEKHYSDVYGRKIVAELAENSELVAGLRVSIGDDVYESSIASRLDQLAHRIR